MSETSKATSLRLEQLAAGERSGAADPEALAQLRASNAEILAAHPPQQVVAEVQRRVALRQAEAQRGRRGRQVVWLGLPTLAAAAIVLLVVRPDPPAELEATAEPVLGDTSSPTGPSDIRIKGLAPHLKIHRQVGDGAELLRSPARAIDKDVLQVSYVAAGATDGVVVSLDGAGAVTLHYPASPTGSSALQQGGAVRLGRAYELDDAPSFERFVFVTASGPVDPRQVLAAAERRAGQPDRETGPLELPANYAQSSFLIIKVSP